MTVRLVPAVHSNLHGFPSAGFMLDIGGLRAYLSGDTDLYGEMKVLGVRYQPNLAIVCVGDGPFTMGPQDAARACEWMGVSQAVPVHFAHNSSRARHERERGFPQRAREHRPWRDREPHETGRHATDPDLTRPVRPRACSIVYLPRNVDAMIPGSVESPGTVRLSGPGRSAFHSRRG